MRQQAEMKRHTDTALEASSDKLGSQLMVAFYMAKNDVPSIQFDKLTELLRVVKAPDFMTASGIYKHHDSFDDMEKSLESVIMKELDEKIE